ncbi:hypothetical protein [Niallia sp. 03133]|uniref:hypothetical protein n=1 Tax=Niallia sp. 03133 TaxID=3458060 RepID=UPI00404408D0
MYSKQDMMIGTLIDDTTAVRSYNQQVLNKIKNLYLKRKIDQYEYSHFVNILTCADLKFDQIKGKLNDFIDKKETRLSSIDIKI